MYGLSRPNLPGKAINVLYNCISIGVLEFPNMILKLAAYEDEWDCVRISSCFFVSHHVLIRMVCVHSHLQRLAKESFSRQPFQVYQEVQFYVSQQGVTCGMNGTSSREVLDIDQMEEPGIVMVDSKETCMHID